MLVAVVGLVLTSAAPASAADLVTAGAGSGTGFEYAPEGTPCAAIPLVVTAGQHYANDTFVLDHVVSTLESVDDSLTTIASYVGPTEMTINTFDLVQAPQGARPGPCGTGPAITPAPVGISSAQVTGTGILPAPAAGGSVNCTTAGANGYYLRVNTTVYFEFVTNCKIEGNVVPGTVNNVPVRFRVTGNQIPCLQSLVTDSGCAPVLDPNATSVMQTQFEADSPTN